MHVNLSKKRQDKGMHILVNYVRVCCRCCNILPSYIPTVSKECTFQSKLSILLGPQFHQERLLEVKNILVMWMPNAKVVFDLDSLPRKTRTSCTTTSDLYSIIFWKATLHHTVFCVHVQLHDFFKICVSLEWHLTSVEAFHMFSEHALCFSRLQNAFNKFATDINCIR